MNINVNKVNVVDKYLCKNTKKQSICLCKEQKFTSAGIGRRNGRMLSVFLPSITIVSRYDSAVRTDTLKDKSLTIHHVICATKKAKMNKLCKETTSVSPEYIHKSIETYKTAQR